MDLLTEYLEAKIAKMMEKRPGVPADWLDDICADWGFTIRWADLGPEQYGALDLWEANILVNSRLDQMLGPQADVWGVRNAVAGHELGHGILHRGDLTSGVELTEKHEEEAFLFADCLLLPRHMLREDYSIRRIIQCWQYRQQMRPREIDYELDAASERFRVSRGAVGNRLVRLNTLERTNRGYRILGRPTSPPTPPPRPPRPEPPPDQQVVAK